ncbi:MAG: hypothetical protein WBA74_08115 [Cyclobacteriaceae bacterium]
MSGGNTPVIEVYQKQDWDIIKVEPELFYANAIIDELGKIRKYKTIKLVTKRSEDPAVGNIVYILYKK